MEETGLRDGLAVTLADRETVETPVGIIRVLPAWEWALSPTPPA
jgi:hypothetical protein